MKISRRSFGRFVAGAAASPAALLFAGTERKESETTEPNPELAYRSAFLRFQMAEDRPGFTAFAVDSLGQGKLDRNMMLPLAPSELRFRVRQQGQCVLYSLPGAEDEPVWTFTFSDSSLLIDSWYSPAAQNHPLVLNFSIDSYATLLGLLSDFGTIRMPALLHFPNQGPFALPLQLRVLLFPTTPFAAPAISFRCRSLQQTRTNRKSSIGSKLWISTRKLEEPRLKKILDWMGTGGIS